MDDAVVDEELFAVGIELSMTVTVTAGMLLFVLLESSSVANGGLPWSPSVKVVEVVSMMAGESAEVGEDTAAGGDSTTAVAAAATSVCGVCDDDSVLELECCCCGSDLVSDILRVAVSRGVLFWLKRLCC